MSTFSAIYTALRGIQTAQVELEVTGQNMTNVNTEGYTRQRTDTSSVGSSSTGMRYASTKVDVGVGVTVDAVTQLRDPSLDIRYRNENAKVGDTETQLSAMSDVENVIDEVSTDGLEVQMENLVSELQTLCEDSGDSVSESTIKTSASLMVSMFNDYATQLSEVWNQQEGYLEDGAVNEVNQLIKNIAAMNQEIKTADIAGASALELKDQRNVMIDELSKYMNIQVVTTSVPIGSNRTVDELSINFVGESGTAYTLVDNDEYASFDCTTTTSNAGTSYVNLNLNGLDGTTQTINDEINTGVFNGYLTMLNDNGEFDAGYTLAGGGTSETTEHGIGYYQLALDTLANKLAERLNAINSTTTEDKPLFESSVSGAEITAANISISSAWKASSGDYLTTSKLSSSSVNTSNNTDNILTMINAFSEDLEFETDNGISLFTGNLEEFISNLSTNLGLEKENMTTLNDTYNSTLNEIDGERLSISSVDINEEGINLIMYNQAMTAACRYMTTLDEALDTIINKMGIVGR